MEYELKLRSLFYFVSFAFYTTSTLVSFVVALLVLPEKVEMTGLLSKRKLAWTSQNESKCIYVEGLCYGDAAKDVSV